MTTPKTQPDAKGSKSGLIEGEGAPTPQNGGARPVEEEDVFGGAERAGNEHVTSKGARP